MSSSQLSWQDLQPNISGYSSVFSLIAEEKTDSLAKVQPRLLNALKYIHQQTEGFPLLLVCSQENVDYLKLIAHQMQLIASEPCNLYGGHYHINTDYVTLHPPSDPSHPFTVTGQVHFAEWIENNQLFGYVRLRHDGIQLEPGLIHRANGSTLVLSLHTLQTQPLLWLRLKRAIQLGSIEWQSTDERSPLPVSIPPLPLNLKLVLCGNRNTLAAFQENDPELYELATYTEFEENLQIVDEHDLLAWCRWTQHLALEANFPIPQMNFWPPLIREAVRYTYDQKVLPLCPRWLLRQIREAFMQGHTLSEATLLSALKLRNWREAFLAERMHDEILLKQIIIETNGELVGQVNGLSVVEVPGHPRPWGEPSRITCVTYPGDGEFTDVERKVELGGKIHAKGIMIMQAYLIAELELEQQLPFSASLVFEQSYSEVDGDSASLAELCALISALANQPVNQQIAVTGSVDQFGNIQPVGGLNEKIEGFFTICNARKLTSQQGVIIPACNVRNLSLNQDVVDAVEQGLFHIWAINRADEALPLLTRVAWRSEKENGDCLLSRIKERIIQFNNHEASYRPWPFSWLNWFK